MTNSRFKFRVFSNGCMHDVYSLSFGKDGRIIGINIFHTIVEKDICLIQSAGLYDCEGKEVFEGDILEYAQEDEIFRLEICWEDYSWILKSKPLENGKIMRESVMQFAVSGILVRCKVMGNRFENSELLENEK